MTETAFADISFADRSVGDIAASLPGATAVFRRRKLDFCCGGRARLADAAAEKGVSLDELEGELAVLVRAAAPAPAPLDTEELIDLIQSRYHDVHRRELPELARLARRVEAVHKDHPQTPHGLAALLERMEDDLVSHMCKEEQVLFPMMRLGGNPMIDRPIAMMMAEHDDHGAHLRALESLAHGFAPPADACNTWRALYAGCAKFADDLVAHIHTENNILFPRFA